MPDEFTDAVREVLVHLYDYSYLQEHRLAYSVAGEQGRQPRERMRLLRSILLEGIEKLKPPADLPDDSPRPRCYRALVLRYVDRLSIPQISHELAVSERQIYRDLRQAESDLATLLWARFRKDQGDRQVSVPGSSKSELLAEVSRLPYEISAINVGDLMEEVVAMLERLVQQRDVKVDLVGINDVDSIKTERQVAYHALLSVMSHAVQHAQRGTTVKTSAQIEADGVAFAVRYLPIEESRGEFPEVAEELIERLGGDCALEIDVHDAIVLGVKLPARNPPVVLVIDDNEDMVELYRRYLGSEQYRLVGALSGQQGVSLAETMQPDIIILDVLMPEEDGWAVLRHLVANETTREVPVIICSVLDDRELALSLGAAAFLPKPVSRLQLLEKVRRYQKRRLPHLHSLLLSDSMPSP